MADDRDALIKQLQADLETKKATKARREEEDAKDALIKKLQADLETKKATKARQEEEERRRQAARIRELEEANRAAYRAAYREEAKDDRIRELEERLRTESRTDIASGIRGVVRQSTSVDLVAMMDCTASMESWIAEAARALCFIIGDVKEKFPALAYRAAFVGYRDYNDGVMRVERLSIAPFTSDIASVQAHIKRQGAITGDAPDEPEDVAGAMSAALGLDWSSMTRLVIHVGDAPPHGVAYHNYGASCDNFPHGHPDDTKIETLAASFREHGIQYGFIKINNSTDKFLGVLREHYEGAGMPFKLNVVELGGDYTAFQPNVSRMLKDSVTSTFKRMSRSDKASMKALPLAVGGKLIGGLGAIAEEDEEEEMRNLEVEKKPPNWDRLGDRVERAVRHTYHFRGGDKALSVLEWEEVNGSFSSSKSDTTVRISKHPFDKGGMRYASYLKDMDLDLKRVAKLPLEVLEGGRLEAYAKADMCTQAVCKLLAKKFNMQTLEKGINRMVSFIDVAVYEFPDRPDAERWMTVEPYIEGEYKKFSNNSGWASNEAGAELAASFSHWTHHETGGFLIAVDIQGVGNVYTDPQIHSKRGAMFGEGDLGRKGVEHFFATHTCNEVCRKLGLVHPDPEAAARMEAAMRAALDDTAIGEEELIEVLAMDGTPGSDMQICCELCGCIFVVTDRDKYMSFRRQGKDLSCNTCRDNCRRDKTQVACSECGKRFPVNLHFYRMKGMDQPKKCRDCKAKRGGRTRD